MFNMAQGSAIMGYEQVRPLCVRVDQQVKAMKRYSTLSGAPKPKPHHQIEISVIPGIPLLVGGLTLLQRIQLMYAKLHQLGNNKVYYHSLYSVRKQNME